MHPHITSSYLLGHRGARGERLENTELGFAYAQQLAGLDGIEFDIQMTQSGEFVVVHDADLSRLTQQSGLISQLLLQALASFTQTDVVRATQSFEYFSQQPFFALTALPPYLAGYRHIEFEIKTHQASNPALLVANLLKVISAPPWQSLPITFTSFDTDVLLQLQLQQHNATRFPTGLLIEPHASLATQIAFMPSPDKSNTVGDRLIYDTFNQACVLGCRQVGIYFPLITPRLMTIAQRFGLAVTAWTVNEVAIATQLYEMGVTTVITDYPQRLLAELGWAK